MAKKNQIPAVARFAVGYARAIAGKNGFQDIGELMSWKVQDITETDEGAAWDEGVYLTPPCLFGGDPPQVLFYAFQQGHHVAGMKRVVLRMEHCKVEVLLVEEDGDINVWREAKHLRIEFIRC